MTTITILTQPQSSTIISTGQPPTLLQVGSGVQGPPGPRGLSGDGSAAISTDPDNRLTTGTDSGLFVPEITADPLAYYILAKA
jgi:hypothetical protein